MVDVIKDGTGTGNTASVNSDNRLLTSAIQQSAAQDASRKGDAYNINTGDVTLTSSNESAVLYVKNNEEQDLIITTVIFLIGASTGGTGDLLASVFANPSAGTIISGAADAEMKANKNFGSNQVLAADVFKGAEGNTQTGSTVAFRSRLDGSSKQYTIGTGDIILPKGSTLAITIVPQASNTSTTLQVALATYLRNAN